MKYLMSFIAVGIITFILSYIPFLIFTAPVFGKNPDNMVMHVIFVFGPFITAPLIAAISVLKQIKQDSQVR